MKWPPSARAQRHCQMLPRYTGPRVILGPWEIISGIYTVNWPPWAHRAAVSFQRRQSVPSPVLRELRPGLRHRAGRPLLSPQAASAQGARIRVPVWARDGQGQQLSRGAVPVSHSAATTSAAGTRQAQEPAQPEFCPVTCRALGVRQSWTDTQTRCAYPPRLLSSGR